MRFGEQVRYEGLNERLYLETLDINPRVKNVYPQPLYFDFKNLPVRAD